METHPLIIDATIWQHAAPPPGHAGSADECYFQTSGSEGLPKWVVHSHAALLANARAVNTHFGITAADHWLLALPLHHIGGFSILVRALESGSAVTQLTGKWNAQHFVSACRATLASLVPTQVFDLVATALPAPESLRAVFVGGGALSAEVAAAARALGWPLLQTYGMTETASQVATQRLDGDEMAVLPIWKLQTDAEDVLTIRGPALAKGYLIRKAANWHLESISPESGFRTRDRVSLTQDGFLRFLGRAVGTVKILGELVDLAPIQARVDALRLELGLHTSDAAVIDVPDARSESRLEFVVAHMSRESAETLLTHLNAQLRPFEHMKTPRFIETMPRGEGGKLKLTALRQMLS